ncbi:hypothetical protein IM660_00150 [Ruania alkalisoli]|uniref:Uncharacterized protein n=1 Tax=Ruania alkalisoli TaxID=2779775 RepID=A0A7M1ST96_9MICO|nr:hypothetical protein [Ruania alkalisoli]QOR70780.1 hypothetical protein IM660_00150 [Ruania alkalisoli]
MTHDADGTAARERLRWGRSQWGRTRPAAWWHAAPLGIVLTVILSIAFSLIGFDAEQRRLALGIGLLCFTGPALALAWIVVVDRSTIRGAVDRPEETVENIWWDKATQHTLYDVVVVIGVGAAVLSLTGWEVTAVTALMALAGLIAADVAIRYVLARRAG